MSKLHCNATMQHIPTSNFEYFCITHLSLPSLVFLFEFKQMLLVLGIVYLCFIKFLIYFGFPRLIFSISVPTNLHLLIFPVASSPAQLFPLVFPLPCSTTFFTILSGLSTPLSMSQSPYLMLKSTS